MVDDTFIPTNKKFLLNDKEYKIYSGLEFSSTSNPRFILFKKEYGILANVAYGADFIFMKDSIIGIRDLNIFTEVNYKIVSFEEDNSADTNQFIWNLRVNYSF